jgi:hypothetical protein
LGGDDEHQDMPRPCRNDNNEQQQRQREQEMNVSREEGAWDECWWTGLDKANS